MANLPTKNNNPGDLRFIGQTGASQGAGGFASFKDPQSGFGALLNDVQTKINKHPDWSLTDFSSVYAPASDGNDVAGYTSKLANQLGVSPDAKISSLQGEIGKFAEAISQNEGYSGQTTDQNTGGDTSSSGAQPASNNSPSMLEQILGLGAMGASAVVGGVQKYAPEIGAALGEDLGGPGGAIAGTGIGNFVSNLFGGGGGGSNIPPTDTGGSSSGNQNDQLLSQLEMDLPESSKQSSILEDILRQGYNATQSGRIAANDPKNQGAISAQARYGLFAPNEQGQMEFNDEKASQLQSQLGDVHDQVIAANDNGQGTHGTKIGNYVGSFLGTDEGLDNEGRQQAAAAAQRKIQADYGGSDRLTPTEMRAKQREHYNQAKSGYGKGMTSSEIAAHKALGNAYGRAIEDSIQDPEQKDLLRRVRKEEGNIIKAKKLGKKLDMKTAPKAPSTLKAALLKTAARYAEIYIGDKIGGPVGAVLGFYIGEKLNRAAFKRLNRTEFDKPGVKAALNILKNQKPIIYHKIKKVAAEQGINIDGDQPKESHKEESKSVEHLSEEIKTDKPEEKVEDFDSLVGKLISRKPTGKSRPKTGLIKPPNR